MAHTSTPDTLSIPQRRVLRKINDGGLTDSREYRTVEVLVRLGLVERVQHAHCILTDAGRAVDGPPDVA